MIAKQSIYNFFSIALAFALGAVSTLYLYPTFPGKAFQGLVVALLAYSNLLQPFISFGVQHALIKFYSQCKTDQDRDQLLWFSMLFPLLLIALIYSIYYFYQTQIVAFLAQENESLSSYVYLILSLSIATAYFEIFYSWQRVHLKTVFGNFLKEFYNRFLVFSALLLFAFQIINETLFISYLIVGYYLRLALMMGYSFWIYRPRFSFKLPQQWKAILRYSSTIFLSGAAASFILDIDKSMLSNTLTLENVAYYSVAVFIATVIEAPGRGMFQIVAPLVSQAIADQDDKRLEGLLKKSASNLLIVSGFIAVVINVNLTDFYTLVNQPGYASAFWVVGLISIGKLYSMTMGCVNTIISNSNLYHYVFWFSLLGAFMAVVLNILFIERYGIMGAAWATLLVMFFINSLKLILVGYCLRIHPFSPKMGITISLVLLCYFIFISFNLAMHPVANILIKTCLIAGIFVVVVLSAKLSDELRRLYHLTMRRLR